MTDTRYRSYAHEWIAKYEQDREMDLQYVHVECEECDASWDYPCHESASMTGARIDADVSRHALDTEEEGGGPHTNVSVEIYPITETRLISCDITVGPPETDGT